MKSSVVVSTLALLAFQTSSYAQSPIFTVTSPAFQDGAALPQKYASKVVGDQQCGGENISPPLSWTNVAAGTKSFAVIAYDSDGNKGLQGNIHWVAYDIAPTATSLGEGAGSVEPKDFVGGMNGRKLNVYFGPCAPANEQPHHYLFSVFATDLPPGQLGPDNTRDDLQTKLKGHVLASGSIVARFSRGMY